MLRKKSSLGKCPSCHEGKLVQKSMTPTPQSNPDIVLGPRFACTKCGFTTQEVSIRQDNK